MTWGDALCRREVDVGVTVHGAIVAQEVEEGNRAAHTGFSDERGALARGIDGASVVSIDAHLNVRIVVVDIDAWAHSFVDVPASLLRVTSILTPHTLEVGCAYRAISLEDTVKLLVVVHHDRGIV